MCPYMELLLQMNRKSVWLFKSEEHLGKICVLRYQVNDLQVIQCDTSRDTYTLPKYPITEAETLPRL